VSISQSDSTYLVTNANSNKSWIFGLEKNNPTNAMICSIIPGGGQVYNEQYWKAGLLFGAGIALTTNLIYNDSRFVETRALISSGNFTGNALENLKLEREYHRDIRDRMGFFILVLYIVSTVDAFVGANLSSFDVDDNISFFMDARNNHFYAGVKFNLFKN
jgi:hypothetical protein